MPISPNSTIYKIKGNQHCNYFSIRFPNVFLSSCVFKSNRQTVFCSRLNDHWSWNFSNIYICNKFSIEIHFCAKNFPFFCLKLFRLSSHTKVHNVSVVYCILTRNSVSSRSTVLFRWRHYVLPPRNKRLHFHDSTNLYLFSKSVYLQKTLTLKTDIVLNGVTT